MERINKFRSKKIEKLETVNKSQLRRILGGGGNKTFNSPQCAKMDPLSVSAVSNTGNGPNGLPTSSKGPL